MADCLGLSYTPLTQKHWGIDLRVVTAGKTREIRGVGTPSQVLRQASEPKRGLVLLMDEAQTVAMEDEKAAMTHTLNAIHNGELGQPVILLAGGLGTTEATFGKLGISRFRQGCVVNLGRLDAKVERAVIHDWLVLDGGTTGDVTPWIDAIARETDGWPQHIVCFTQPAAQVLQLNQGRMTDPGLTYMLRRGRDGKAEYYDGRVLGISRGNRTALAQVLVERAPSTELEEEEVLALLAQVNAPDRVQAVFDMILHKGVLAWTPSGRLAIPIPSMQDWLIRMHPPERKLGAGGLGRV